MKEFEKSNNEPSLEEIEKKAFELAAEGRMLFAINKLEEAIKHEERWYYFFYKAIWLYESGKQHDATQVVIYGLNFEKAKEFYFHYIGADLLYRVAWTQAHNIEEIGQSITKMDQAIQELKIAELSLFKNKKDIESSRQIISKELKNLYPTFLNTEDLAYEVQSLRTKIENMRQTTLTFKAIIEAENRVNASIEANRSRIESERVRTIELLGIFTAIFAFIFSGVQIFTRLPFSDALVLHVGMALVLIIFFLGLHLVIDRQGRTKGLIALLVFLVIVLLTLPFYARFLQNTFADKANVVPTVSQENVRSVNENRTIEEKDPKGKVGDMRSIQK